MIQDSEKSSKMKYLDKCPVCGGTGYEIRMMDASELYGFLEDGSPELAEYCVPCSGCNGGYAQKVDEAKTKAEIPQVFYNADLNSFSWTIYRDDQGKTIDLGQQKRFVESFVNEYDTWKQNHVGLYIWSKMKGSGKTFLASAICGELMKSRIRTTKFVQTANLINIAKSTDESLREYKSDPIGLLCNCELLVLDDLGSKNTGGEWLDEILFRIMDSRMNNGLLTIITSNYKMSELPVSDRVATRINDCCQAIPLPDYSVRSRSSSARKSQMFKELGLI